MRPIAWITFGLATLTIIVACTPPSSEVAQSSRPTADAPAPAEEGLSSRRRERVEAFIGAHAAGDPESFRRWLLAHRTAEALAAAPMDARLGMFARDAERWGGLKTKAITLREPDTAVLRATPANGGPDVKVTFQFDASDDDRIGAMTIGAWVDLPQTWSNLDDYAKALQAASGIPALAIGVLRSGEVVDHAVAGRRRIDRADAAQIDDTFHWGSLAKSVTGTMLAALIREGVLDWDTTVGEALGEMPMQDAYRDATLWQAMSHQAGFPPYTNFTREMVDAILAQGGDTWTENRSHMVAQILMDPPLGPPGTVGEYSNAGVTVAGYMAERITGMNWRELVQRHVFDPLGMRTAGFDWPAANGRSDQPFGHFGSYADDYQVHDPQMMAELVAILDPAGNVRSSIGDMLRYGALHLHAMRATQPTAELEAIAELHRQRRGAIPVHGEPYTFGWGHRCTGFPDAVRCHWHNGGGGSFFAELRIFPDDDLVLAYAGNAAEPTESISGDVMRALYERYAR